MTEPFPPPHGDMREAVRILHQAASARKCWACGCLHNSLVSIERAVPPDQRTEELAEVLGTLRQRLLPVKYDCRGCDPCFPPEAMNALGIEDQACPAEEPQERSGWPPLAGEYTVLRYQAPVAISTLTDHDLSEQIAQAAGPEIAIVGTVQTENLGIERCIQNILANPNIRFFILCGHDSRKAVGHLPGQSLLALAANGLNDQARIVEAKGKRPQLRNVSPQAVAHFRKTVEVVDMVGKTDVPVILDQARRCAARSPGPSKPFFPERHVEVIEGRVPARMTPDPCGYFVIYTDRQRGILNMEHYSNEGVLDLVVEGDSAAKVYLPAIERGLVSRLDHAAYLGQELARAQQSMASGQPYTQDAAPEGVGEPCKGGSCRCSTRSPGNRPDKE